MDPAYAERYPTLAREHWWWRARRAALRAELARMSPPDGSLELLEVGCASGANFEAFEPFGRVSGLEPEEALLPKDARLREQIRHGALDSGFEPQRPVDRLLMLDVLEHVKDPVAFLQEARRIAAPKGRLMLTVPAHPWLWTRHDRWNHHRVRYTKAALRAELEASGWNLERSRFLFHGLVPAKLGARALEGLRGNEASLPSLPPGPLGALAFGYFRAEQLLLGPLRLPLGGSLLAIARPR